MSNHFFTSESVSEGHPDKVADQISDAILDYLLERDKNARVAVETMVKTGMAIIAGEITTSAWVDLEEITRGVILDIGYDSSELGFDGATCAVLNAIGKQSPDIAQGVDRDAPEKQGAGDQGMMFGYASNETDVLMPAPIYYAHELDKKQAAVRRGTSDEKSHLRPDAKSQVTFAYEDGKPASTPNFLQWRRGGPKAAEPVFISGHPGSTDRLLTVTQLKMQRDVMWPLWLLRYSELRGRMLAAA